MAFREKAGGGNGRGNREELWHILRMYDVSSQLLNGINSIMLMVYFVFRVKG